MTNRKMLELHEHLNSLQGLTGVKFNYAVSRNLSRIEDSLKAIRKAGEPSSAFNEFDKERITLAIKYAKKDEKDQPLTDGKQYLIEDQKAFSEEFSKLKEKHKDAISKRDMQLEEIETLLDQDSTIELFKVKISDVPEAITTEQMKGIIDIVEYE